MGKETYVPCCTLSTTTAVRMHAVRREKPEQSSLGLTVALRLHHFLLVVVT